MKEAFKAGGGRDQFILSHLPLVNGLAHSIGRNLPPSIDMDDLNAAGIFGLLEAMDRFQRDYGVAFSTYAACRIKGAIFDFLRQNDDLPRSLRRWHRKAASTRRDLESRHGRSATNDEMAESIGITAERYGMLFHNPAHSMPVHPSVRIDPLDQLLRTEAAELLLAAIERLPRRERLAVLMYYFERRKTKEIGAVLDLDRTRISQILARAATRLRGIMRPDRGFRLRKPGWFGSGGYFSSGPPVSGSVPKGSTARS